MIILDECKCDWPCGPTDKASDYESGDSRFESWQGRFFFSPTVLVLFPCLTLLYTHTTNFIYQ